MNDQIVLLKSRVDSYLGKSDGAISDSMREKIGAVGSEHREDMPADAFLEGAERKYPVKTKVSGEWKYSPTLLLAAARRARMQGREDLASRADKLRGEMENTMHKSSAEKHDLLKAHIDQYTRKDGTVVQAHETSVQAAQQQSAIPPLHAHVKNLRAEGEERGRAGGKTGGQDDSDFHSLADHLESGDYKSAGQTLSNMDTEPRDKAFEHIHPAHHEKLGFPPINMDRSLEKYNKLHPAKASKPAPKK